MTYALIRFPEELDRLVAFGRFVRRARQCAGLSQQRLADLSGVSQSVISRLERGLAPRLGLERILALQAVLGGCLPIGVCPHDHNCIWQPRDDVDKRFTRRPGIPTARQQRYARRFPVPGNASDEADAPALADALADAPASTDGSLAAIELDLSDGPASQPAARMPITTSVNLFGLDD